MYFAGYLQMKIGLVVTVRVKSSRLKEKALQLIKGRRTIDMLLDHVIPNDDFYDVVLAIPENKDDDILKEIGTQRGIEVYRGEDESPMHRLHAVAVKYEYDYVIRITADDILIDQNLLRQQINWAINGKLDYCYMRRCPEGVAGEVIKTEALDTVVSELGDMPVEFISYYMKRDDFKYNEYYPPYEYQYTFRLTMDYEEDLKLIREIYNMLPEPIGTLDIINCLKRYKSLCQINKLPDVTVYTANYNYSKYIVDCMKSVHGQTITDFEYIVVDDCSTDESSNKIMEYYSGLDYDLQRKTKIYRNDKNKGLPATCNEVLSMARGKFLIRVDADDVLYPDAIEKMLDKMKLENAMGCLSGYEEVKEAMSTTSVVTKNMWHPASCILNRWCVNEIKYREGVEYMEGVPFFNEFRKRYRVSFVNEPLWKYRKHDKSKTASPEHPLNG